MNTILVTTDFSRSSRNALAYACSMFGTGDFHILLLHAYAMPATYTTEGIALAAMGDAFVSVEERLIVEQEWVKEQFPDLPVGYKAVMGNLMDALQQQIGQVAPGLIVMAALTDYDDLWTWDNDVLRTFRDLAAPVLVIPEHVRYQPLKNIGFACDYKSRDTVQINFIKWLATHTGALLHVVHVSRSKSPDPGVQQENETRMKKWLQDVAPAYHVIEDPQVITAITGFVREHHIDLLIVIPHRYGIWDSIFKQSHTLQLARLNYLPVLALHDA